MILELTRPSEMGLAADLRRKLHEETLSDKNLWSQCLGQIRSFLSLPPALPRIKALGWTKTHDKTFVVLRGFWHSAA